MTRLLSGLWVAGLLLVSPGARADDEATLRQLMTDFFTTYAAKDLDKVMSFWSAKSPDAATRRTTWQELFADTGPLQLKSLKVDRVEVKKDQARVRVSVALSGTSRQTGQPHPAFGKLLREFELIREGETWKILH